MRSFDVNSGVVLREIVKDDIIRDDELFQMIENPLFRFRLGVDQQVIWHREDIRIR